MPGATIIGKWQTREKKMICKIREWKLSNAASLAAALSNKKVQDNLRDGLPYPYTEQDGIDFISAMLSADKSDTFAFAVTIGDKVLDMKLYSKIRELS